MLEMREFNTWKNSENALCPLLQGLFYYNFCQICCYFISYILVLCGIIILFFRRVLFYATIYSKI